jgi:organic hydroperoxide reductase OsmC/OhrA
MARRCSGKLAGEAQDMARTHIYRLQLRWTGNSGEGTASYRGYSRDHDLIAAGKPVIAGSSDPTFLGDKARWNPEELLLASVAACHELWYLGLCASAGIVVTAYEDLPEATMVEDADGSGRFTAIMLRPHVTLANPADMPRAMALHHEANAKCFIANSLNLPVAHEPTFAISAPPER